MHSDQIARIKEKLIKLDSNLKPSIDLCAIDNKYMVNCLFPNSTLKYWNIQAEDSVSITNALTAVENIIDTNL